MSGSWRGTALATALCGVLAFAGCERDLGTSRGVVEEFLDLHYVNINLDRSKDYTIGLARKKVEGEISLTAGVEIDAATRKPRVYYDLIEKRENRGGLAYLYELTILPEDANKFTRRVLIRVRREDDGWRISNFMEY